MTRKQTLAAGAAALIISAAGITACSSHKKDDQAVKNAIAYARAWSAEDYKTTCGLSSQSALAGAYQGSVQKCIDVQTSQQMHNPSDVRYALVKSEPFSLRGVTGTAVELAPSVEGNGHLAVAVEDGTHQVIGVNYIEGTDLDANDPLAATMYRIVQVHND
jgi:hypothetical protein